MRLKKERKEMEKVDDKGNDIEKRKRRDGKRLAIRKMRLRKRKREVQ